MHVDDAQQRPMEILGCEHRTFPGEGRIDVPALLAEIKRRTRYDGYYSVELYDKDIWAMPPAKSSSGRPQARSSWSGISARSGRS